MTLRLFRMLVARDVIATMEYRGGFFLLMVRTLFGPIVSLAVWLAVSSEGVALPYSREQFVSYYLMLGLVSMLTGTWLGEYLAQEIRLGEISLNLLRPVPIIAHYAANNLGEKVVKLPLLLPLIALAALLFRGDLRLASGPLPWLLFALSLPLAAAVAFLLDFVLGTLAFWVDDVQGLIRLKALVGAFLSGQLVPLALFPPALGPLLEAQPFRYTLSFPLEVLAGGLDAAALTRGFAWQCGYLALLYAAYRLLWRFGLRAYGANGA
jgi:ABC-2 type transport system permease protein